MIMFTGVNCTTFPKQHKHSKRHMAKERYS